MTGLSSLPLAQETKKRNFKGTSRILGPRWAHLPTVTIGFLGAQILGSVSMSYASPYLLSLGLSKSRMAVVFVAGPLSGLLMQPLIGVVADNCTSRFGRRRPYMMLGSIICVFAMLLLGFTRAVAAIFTGWNNDSNDTLTIWLAVLSIYLIDFAINAVQAMDRALLVDTLPSSDQAAGNAWAARMTGVGGVVGFFVGNINLPRFFPFLGKSQLQVLSVIVSVLLFGGHLLMAVLVKERVLLKTHSTDGNVRSDGGLVKKVRDIWRNLWTLPRVIRQICIIQFFASIAWFPVLFYSTIYIGDLYKRASPFPSSPQDQADLDTEGTRLGSRAWFYSSLLSLGVILVMPSFVAEAGRSSSNDAGDTEWQCMLPVPKTLQVPLATLWAVSHLVFAGCMFATLFTDSVWGATFIFIVIGFAGAVGQWAPFSLLGEAILTEPAMTDGEEGGIQLTDTRTRSAHPSHREGDSEREVLLPGDDADHSDDEEEKEKMNEEEDSMEEERRRVLSNSGAQLSLMDLNESGVEGRGHGDEEDYEIVGEPGVARRGSESVPSPVGGSLSSKAGVVLGIHNIFIVIPQFFVTGFSAVIFAVFDPKKNVAPGHDVPPMSPVTGNGTTLLIGSRIGGVGNVTQLLGRGAEMLAGRDEVDEEHSNSVVYIFQVGGLAAFLAFVLSWRLARELRHRRLVED